MRFLAMVTLLLVFTFGSAIAQTYDPRYPVCMKAYLDRGGEWIDCSFTSLLQCRASAAGRPAMCETNPYFAMSQKRRSGDRAR
jgi:hypothetical protein